MSDKHRNEIKEAVNLFNKSIKTGKLKEVKATWQKYLEGKTLILFEFGGDYNLLAIKGEKGLKGLCEYEWQNDVKSLQEEGYESLREYTEEVNLGNDGFGFDKDEIELIDIEKIRGKLDEE